MGKQKLRQRAAFTGTTVVLPIEMRKVGEALFEQQMWCWGCDVRREAGNLLLAYGMEKHPSPEPRYHSAYHSPLEADGALTLWGWGLWIAMQNCGSAFISRSNFRVHSSSIVALRPAVWCEAQLPRFCTELSESKSDCLLATAFRWIADYERWLARLVEPNYRECVLAAWPQRRRYRGGIPPCEVPDRWMQLAQIVSSTMLI
jgi:hypothetical protein